MKELVYSVKVVTRDALLGNILDAADRIRNLAEAEKSYSRSSQQSGSLCCGLRWHFRKPALSTDQIKGNFTQLTLHLYFKRIMYYVGELFCSVYCQ